MLTSILQPTHLLIILGIALLVLGPKRLPEAGRSLGQGLKEFRSSISPTRGEDQDDLDQSLQTRPDASSELDGR